MSRTDRPENEFVPLRELCDHVPGAVIFQLLRSAGGDAQFCHISSNVDRILGVSRTEALADAEAILSLMSAADRNRLVKTVKAALHTHEVAELSLQLRIATGEFRLFRCRAIPSRRPDGLLQIDGIFIDLAETQRFEQALRASENRFRAFMDHSPTIAWMKDSEGRYVYVSRAYEDRFGIRLADWIGKTDYDLWPQDLAAQFHASDNQALIEDRTIHVVERGRDLDGAEMHWWVFKFPFTDAQGRRYAGGIGIDVTERERVKTELSKKNAELQSALDRVQRLEKSLVTMCAWTRRIRMDGRWVDVEEFLREKFGVRVSHGISEDALQKIQESEAAESGTRIQM